MWATTLAADLLACLRFYTRLPIPAAWFETAPHDLGSFGRSIRLSPLAGAIVGATGAAVLAAAHAARLPDGVAAGLALVALLLTTGVFHEDGLADTADGFGGGQTRERKLEIMRDSRVGSYGAAAMAMSLLLRWSALAALLGAGVARAAVVLIAAHAAARAIGLIPLALLPPARADGAAFAAARPRRDALATAAALALAIGMAPIWTGVAPAHALAALACAVVAGLAMAEIARRQIGGQTGDVAGAAQQLAEITMLCALSAGI